MKPFTLPNHALAPAFTYAHNAVFGVYMGVYCVLNCCMRGGLIHILDASSTAVFLPNSSSKISMGPVDLVIFAKVKC